jgi:LysM domain-containing protein
MASPMSITTAARCVDGDVWAISELNPSLLPPVRAGRAAIPAGYSLRVPAGEAERFRRCAVSLPVAEMARRATERRNVASHGRADAAARVHRVQRGQTLAAIAARYGCTVDQIRRGNSLKSGAVRTGQLLRIPPC